MQKQVNINANAVICAQKVLFFFRVTTRDPQNNNIYKKEE